MSENFSDYVAAAMVACPRCRAPKALCGVESWADRAGIDVMYWHKSGDRALDAILARLSEHVAGQVREHIAAEIERCDAEMRKMIPNDLGPDQYEVGYLAGLSRAKLCARSSRPVVTEKPREHQ